MTNQPHSSTSSPVKKEIKTAESTGENPIAAPAIDASPSPLKCFPWSYALTFLAFWVFCSLVYGEVFHRAAEANFVTTDSNMMKFLTDQQWGELYWGSRWLLLSFKNTIIGGLLLSILLTLIAVVADRVLGLSHRWQGISAVLPAMLLGWMMWRGTNLYYKNEPSLIFLLPVLLLVFLILAWGVRHFFCKKRGTSPHSARNKKQPQSTWAIAIPLILFPLLYGCARHFNENEILTASLQNNMMKGNWDEMTDDVLSAKRPSRAVAAYYAISLLQNGQLVERLFEIPFDYPKARLDQKDGNEEYGLFLADCNFYAGLINSAYRSAMDQTVMNGPNLYYLKRLALCAIMNEEMDLAKKYLGIIGKVPFEQEFINHYEPMTRDISLINADPELSRVKALAPQETNFEQSYRTPAFMGYNTGMLEGADASLETAMAACLYAKELPRLAMFAQVYAQKNGGRLPVFVQQALAILANTNPTAAQAFSGFVAPQRPTLTAFYAATHPIIQERKEACAGKDSTETARIKTEYNAKLREVLQNEWLGTYYYYYYCENNDPSQVRPATSAGVN